jgi:hypothetical protein
LSEIKQQSIQLIQSLPDDVTIDNIMEELYFKLQFDKGLEELDKGEGIDQEVVEHRMSKWLIK